jgi:hypothetical protein
MKDNPLRKLGRLGQSIWLDYIRRDLIVSGELRRLIEEDGLRGMTSNPSIFEKAIAGSHDYDEDIRVMVLEGKGVKAIYEALSQRDVQSAADEFRPLYDKTEGIDGYVSLEVNPHLARPPDSVIESGERYGYIIIVQLTEKGAIGDTSNIPESGLSPVHHNPSNPDPTPENHNNYRGMSNSHKDSGNKLVEALQLSGER